MLDVIVLHSNKTAFQATSLPVIPGVVSRTTAIPSLGNLQDLYPEKFGGVSSVVLIQSILSLIVHFFRTMHLAGIHLCTHLYQTPHSTSKYQ